MEVEVRRVSGERTCFVSLPLHVIYLLQESESVLPSFLVLDIRLLDRNKQKSAWCLAWAGASSKSQSIEVPDKLAECIGLPHGARVRMKVRTNVIEAISVAVEPVTEDDWEILELNAEYLEDNILSKVGVVQAGQRFPVWVQGEMVLLLKVISTKPNSVVKLVQGTELIVAPKNRQSRIVPPKDLLAHEGKEALPAVEPYFRIQEMDPSAAGSCLFEVKGLSVVLTTAVFISPFTAKTISLTNRQFVVLAGPDFGKAAKNNERKNPISHESLHNGLEQELSVEENIVGEKAVRPMVLQVIFWTRVARGHVMLPNALQLFLGVKTHSRVKLKPYNRPVKQSPYLVSICPVKFIPTVGRQSSKVKMVTGDLESVRPKNVKELARYTTNDLVSMNWSKHVQVLAAAAACNNSSERVDHEGVNNKSRNVKSLLSCWLAAQLAICSKFIPENGEAYIPVSMEAIMCFQLKNVETFLDDGQFPSVQLIETHDNADADSRPFPSYSHQGKMLQSHFVFFLLSVQSEEVGPSSDGPMPKYLSEARDQNVCFFFHNHFPFGDLPKIDMNSEAKLTNTVTEVQLGRPLYLAFEKEILEREAPTLDAMNWLRKPALEALSRLKVLLSPIARENMKKLGTPFPGGVMLHGPHACGKSRLALAVAQQLEKDVEVLAHRVMLKCAELLGEQDQLIRRSIQKAVAEAVEHAPSLIILDDLDALVPVSNTEGSEPSISTLSLAEFLADIIDASQVVTSEDIGSVPVAFLATSRAPSAVPSCLHSSGRFDYYVELLAPAVTERTSILQHAVDTRGVTCDQSVLEKVAASCDGYDTSDLEVLLDRSTHAAAARYISISASNESEWRMAMGSSESLELNSNGNTSQIVSHIKNKKFKLLNEDFDKALENFVPAAMRGISKAGKEGKCGGWEDVGGLREVRYILQEMLELPLKHGKLFSNAPLRLRSGVLLYGPPGCGKTHLVGAAVAAASLRFISVKGPELLNKYIGASEQGVRDLFTKAATAAPCVLFFDEFDAIAPRRGHDNTGVTDRVVNQLLTELDGVEALNGVFVFAATSRPDLIDAALLRPGRLDRLLYCDFPSYQERLEILQILSRKLHLEEDVELHIVAEATEGFSGADLQAVLSDAQLESVHSFLDAEQSGNAVLSAETRSPCLTMRVLMSVALKARPSVPEAERRRLANIYNAFRGGRSPGSSKRMQDVKGKKATLA